MWFNGMKPPIRRHLPIVISLVALAAAGCSKSNEREASAATPEPKLTSAQPSASSPAPSAGTGAYACTLLTGEEAAAVQGEPFKATNASQKVGAGLIVSQCYFELPTTVNSIVVTLTQRGEGADARDPKQSWQEIFHREKSAEKKGEEEEKEPQKIEGIGEEAFWSGSRVGGALYVLKGNSYIRISVGGAGDQAQKTEKSKALAQSVLKRL